MMRPSWAHREPSASFAANGVKTQAKAHSRKPSFRQREFAETQIGRFGVTSSAEAVSLIRPQLRYGHSREKVPYLGPTRRPPHKCGRRIMQPLAEAPSPDAYA